MLPVRFINISKNVMILMRYCIFILLLSVLPTYTEAAVVAKKITVVFRYDDPSAKTSMDIEARLIEAFRQHNMCCTFAVVPFVCADDVHDPEPQEILPLPPSKIEVFSKAMHEGILEIAQHGYSHQTNGLQAEGYSEFAGLGYETQLQRIEQGKKFLESEFGLPITIFVPPWNAYDANTIRALGQAGFECLSADADRIGYADALASLRFLPATCGIAEVQSAVITARLACDPAPLIVVLFHNYDFREVNGLKGTTTFDSFFQTLTWLSQQRDVGVCRMEDVEHVTMRRYLENQRILRMRLRLPATLGVYVYPLIFLSEDGVRNLRPRCVLLLVTFYVSVVLAVGVLSYLTATIVLARTSVFISRLLLFLGPLFLIGGSVWTFHDGQYGEKGLMAIVGVLGYCVGTMAASLSRRCRVRVWNYAARLEG